LKQKKTTNRINSIISDIQTHGPRAAVLTAAALLERLLITPIMERFVTINEYDYKELFHTHGPLSSFGNRIQIAYAMGIYGPKMRHDLELILSLRNVLATSFRNVELQDYVYLLADLHCMDGKFGKLTAQEVLAEATRRPALSIEEACVEKILAHYPPVDASHASELRYSYAESA
jgi:DNA-binding MltR family transcriptional regulator